MRLSVRTTVSLPLVVAVLAGCPFNNPYEYYGQACSADKPCDAPGLECVDGTCRGAACATDDDCQAPFTACAAGRCLLGAAHDASAGDSSSADRASSDASGVDAAGVDGTAGDAIAIDTTATDAVGVDTAAVDAAATDGAAVDVTVVGDGGGADTAAPVDASAPTDGAGADTTTVDTGAGWDAAAAVNCSPGSDCASGQRCVEGYCQPLLCDTAADCVSPDVTCVKADPTATWSGTCAPRLCSSDADCGHPLLGCETGTCIARRGQPYQACVVADDGSSWCAPGLDCVLPYEGGLGTCQQRCDPSLPQPCPGGFECVGMGLDATLATDGVGVCLATCGGYAVDAPLPVDPELSCSVPGAGGNPPGLLLNIPEAFLGMTCSASQPCGGPFVCADLGSRGRYCLLTPEALFWQAKGSATILLVDRDSDSTPESCDGDLYLVTGSGGTSLCLPRCLDDHDCRFAVPAAASPRCVQSQVYPQAPGFCSVAAPFSWNGSDSCFRPDLYVQGTSCNSEAASNDADGDGFFSAVDQCDTIPGSMGGCDDWPCRVNADCGANRYCMKGRCGTVTEHCRSSCQSDEMDLGQSFCPSGMRICVPYRDLDLASSFCGQDGDCSSVCTASPGCVCLASTCVPAADASCPLEDRYLGACVPAEFVSEVRVACTDAMDCPAGTLCETGDGRCYFPGGGPVACLADGSCPSGQTCFAGYCWDTGCADGPGGACLDCDLINGPDARWTRAANAPAGGCPCGMTQAGATCHGKRVLCSAGAPGGCPGGFACRAGRCVADKSATGDCPPWHAVLPDLGPAPETCASCLDAQAEPAGWNLPCYASGDPLCPCGLLCLPDVDGNGQCRPAPLEAECMTGLVDGAPCEGGGVWLDGRCRWPRHCASASECDSGWSCAPDLGGGPGFCVPNTSLNCNQPGTACGGSWAGTCVDYGGPDYCVPNALIPRGANVAGCTFAPSLCGPTCACMHDGTNLVTTELRPRDCGPNAFGLGDFCMNLTDLYTEAGLAAGQPCYARGLPGRGREKATGVVACAPTGELPSPGCTKFTCTSAAQTCQLGGCYGACPAGQANCPGTSQCLAPLGSPVPICLLPSHDQPTPCSSSTPSCFAQGAARGEQGGICLRTAGFDVCYPRLGCDLLTDGETCVDGAPVMLGELDAGELCAPWSRSPCRLGEASCAAGLCHPSAGGLGLCGASAECGHWLECGMGELCLGGRCRPYAVAASANQAGDLCDASPYHASAQGRIWAWDPAAPSGLCLVASDPRCGGRAPGQVCDQVLDPRHHQQRPTLVCSSHQACIEVEALPPCGQPGQACIAPTNWTGSCVETLRGSRCVP